MKQMKKLGPLENLLKLLPGAKKMGLNDIKISMIEQATKNATAAGEQFAKDADARLGKIKSANQGVFSIESRDPTDSWSSNERQAINKKVRVVATITFYLK